MPEPDNTMTLADYLARQKPSPATTSKYRNTPTTRLVDGVIIKFDSKAEAEYFDVLQLRVMAGELIRFERQIRIPCLVNGEPICTYVADFKLFYPDGRIEYIDVKGYMKSDAASWKIFQLKIKLVKAIHGISIVVATKP